MWRASLASVVQSVMVGGQARIHSTRCGSLSVQLRLAVTQGLTTNGHTVALSDFPDT